MSDIIVNKVIKGDETYLDLTNDTVSEGALLKNRTAHNSEGIQIQGTMEDGGGSVTGVKGDAESVYRDGDVNITAANIGTYTTSQIDALLNNKVDAHGTDSLMTNAEHVKLAGIEAGAEENVIESISLNGEEITPVNKAVALSIIDKDVNDLTNYYKKSETDASLGAKQNIILSSTLSIGGQTVTEVEEALGSLAGISKPMTGATSSSAGEGGFVPSPSAGDENKALFGDGTWKPVSGGGGGHTILDEDGTTYPQRSKLQFEGCEVTDDSTNDITKIKAEGGVTGVKGNAETDYRTGNVNLTPAHVGAVDEVEYEEDIYGVNLLNLTATTQTINGVTFTVNKSAGTITANGTATANVDFQFVKNAQIKNILKVGESYIFTTALQGGATGNITLRYKENGTDKYILFNTGVFTAKQAMVDNGVITWWVNSGQTVSNVVAKPMLRKATIKDDTYRPFNEQSIQNQLTDQTNVLGAKNLIPYPYKDGDAKTALGITYTKNPDNSVKLNGIATSSGGFNLCIDKPLSYFGIYQPGKYILSCGDFSVASGDRVYVAIRDMTKGVYYNTWRSGISSDNPEQEIVIDSNNINDIFNCYIWVQSGVTVNNAVVKPMLRLASDPDNTYVPYAMTNRELTERMLRLSVFNSNYSIPIADCDSFIGVFGVTNAPTLNTPYKAGLTGGYAGGMIIQIVPNTTGLWNTQIYIASGCGNTSSPSTTNVIFIRAKSNSSAWSPWTKLI